MRTYKEFLLCFVLVSFLSNCNLKKPRYIKIIKNHISQTYPDPTIYEPIEYSIISDVRGFREYTPNIENLKNIIHKKIKYYKLLEKYPDRLYINNELILELKKENENISLLMSDAINNLNKIDKSIKSIESKIAKIFELHPNDPVIIEMDKKFRSLHVMYIIEQKGFFAPSLDKFPTDDFYNDLNNGLYIYHKYKIRDITMEGLFRLDQKKTKVIYFQAFNII